LIDKRPINDNVVLEKLLAVEGQLSAGFACIHVTRVLYNAEGMRVAGSRIEPHSDLDDVLRRFPENFGGRFQLREIKSALQLIKT